MKEQSLAFSLLLVLLVMFLSHLAVRAQGADGDRRRGFPKPTPTPWVTSQAVEDGPTIQIIGGDLASPGEYPWMVALVRAGHAHPFSGHFCGGSLIAPDRVLTAAHCVANYGLLTREPDEIDVVLGVNRLSDGPA